jgi:hypothetical protein
MTPEFLASIAAVILSLLASYLPGFSTWYDSTSPNQKRLIMLALLAHTTAGSFGLACAGFADQFGVVASCTEVGAIDLIKAFIAAVIANQAAYAVTPRKPASVGINP